MDVVDHLYQDILPNDEAMKVPLIRSEAFRSVARALLHCFPHTFRELLERAPSSSAEDVEETALRWGFADQESFVRRYRGSFGEAPAHTLHR